MSDAETIYMFTDGSYSNYEVTVHIQGPANVDIEPFLTSAYKAAKDAEADHWRREEEEAPNAYSSALPEPEKARRRERILEWRTQNPFPRGAMARLLDALSPLGFREISVVEVHEYEIKRADDED